MIAFQSVSKRYAGAGEALQDVSFEIERGEMVFITGHSGAGKSTMLRLIGLIERSDRGAVLVDGRNLSQVSSRKIPLHRRRLGMIFQDHRLLLDRTVFDNVALPLVVASTPRAEIVRRVNAALEKVGLNGRQRARPAVLSGGEQQRVGIARAIVHRPRLIIADEPTGNLDPELSRDIFDLFKAFNDTGTTVLIASHDLHLIRDLGRRSLVLSEGRLIDDVAARIKP